MARRSKAVVEVHEAVGYVRVSREEQAANGTISIEMQTDEITRYCQQRRWHLVKIVRDERSGGDLNRAGVREVLGAATQGTAQVVVVFRVDRLTRSLQDWANTVALFHANGVRFASASEAFDTTTPEGEAMGNLLATFAQYERRIIGARQRSRIRARRDRGEWQGALPYGWACRKGQHKHPEQWREVPEEQAVLRRVRELRDAGQSYRSIADQLNWAGVETRRGRPWSPVTVRYLLTDGAGSREAAIEKGRHRT